MALVNLKTVSLIYVTLKANFIISVCTMSFESRTVEILGVRQRKKLLSVATFHIGIPA